MPYIISIIVAIWCAHVVGAAVLYIVSIVVAIWLMIEGFTLAAAHEWGALPTTVVATVLLFVYCGCVVWYMERR